MQGERNIRQLHSSHINRSSFLLVEYFSGSFLIILMAVWAAQMSDFQLNTEWESTGQINIDYAWPGQFVWAVVYKPFRAQSIGIYKMTNGFVTAVMDEMQRVIWVQSTREDWLVSLKNCTHCWCLAAGRRVHTWVDWAVISAFWNILGPKVSFSLINKRWRWLLGNGMVQFLAEMLTMLRENYLWFKYLVKLKEEYLRFPK